MLLVVGRSNGIRVRQCNNRQMSELPSSTMLLFAGTNVSIFLVDDQGNTDLKAFCHFHFPCNNTPIK